MQKLRTIVWFKDIGKNNTATVGGKGANLGELTGAGIPVPPGFVVATNSYFAFLKDAGIEATIRLALDDLDYNDSANLMRRAEAIKTTIEQAPMPPGIAEDIREAYRQLGEGPVAVRSSATAEDMAEASFAGQQSTFLNVVGEDNVVKAVQACWASLFEARAIFYRYENHFDNLSVGIAVPVQRMVQSERSGVMFTVEPVTSDRSKIVIEAIWGLGEGIVSGEVTPDLYVMRKDPLTIENRHIADQPQELIRNSAGSGAHEGANVWSPVPEHLRQEQKLSDSHIRELATIGLNVERHYGWPQDIEWAWEGGQFFLVQTRPVTTITEHGTEAAETGRETARVLLQGSAAGPGVASGPVRIVRNPMEIDLVQPGDVLVSEMTTPDFVPGMKRAAAIITDRGGRTCHAAIVSRELGIPCVVGSNSATRDLQQGQLVTVDGSAGLVYEGRAETRLAWYETEKVRRSQVSDLKTKVKLLVNLAEPELAEAVAARNVDGVGLLRAEFIVAQIGEHPRLALNEGRREEFVTKLTDGIRAFASAFAPRQVIYRATDFKTNEYSNLRGGKKYEESEENPMIGYRGASRYIREPEVFKMELDAIKRVRKDYPNLWVMIPFVRTPDELAAVKKIMEDNGLPRSEDFKLWMMAEVPSNVLLLDKFIDIGIDGISIGSNDLTQLVLGIDRDNSKFAVEFDERNEAVIMALESIVTTARKRGIPCSICGQAPSVYPELSEKLVRWGVTSVSVSPDMIEQTREIIYNAEQNRPKPERTSQAKPV